MRLAPSRSRPRPTTWSTYTISADRLFRNVTSLRSSSARRARTPPTATGATASSTLQAPQSSGQSPQNRRLSRRGSRARFHQRHLPHGPRDRNRVHTAVQHRRSATHRRRRSVDAAQNQAATVGGPPRPPTSVTSLNIVLPAGPAIPGMPLSLTPRSGERSRVAFGTAQKHGPAKPDIAHTQHFRIHEPAALSDAPRSSQGSCFRTPVWGHIGDLLPSSPPQRERPGGPEAPHFRPRRGGIEPSKPGVARPCHFEDCRGFRLDRLQIHGFSSSRNVRWASGWASAARKRRVFGSRYLLSGRGGILQPAGCDFQRWHETGAETRMAD